MEESSKVNIAQETDAVRPLRGRTSQIGVFRRDNRRPKK